VSFDSEITGALEALELQKVQCEQALAGLPVGNLVKRMVKGHPYYYLVRRESGKVRTEYKGKLSHEELAQYADIKQNRERYSRQISQVEKAISALRDVPHQPVSEAADSPADDGSTTGPAKRDETRAAPLAPPERSGRTKPRSTASGRPKIVARVRPLVVLFGSFPRDICIRMAREWGWDLLDLELTEDAVPQGVAPSAIISDKLSTHPVVERLLAEGRLAVRLGTAPHPLDNKTPAILPDLERAGRMAALHFLERGFKAVAHVGNDPQDPESLYHPMYLSFRQCVEAQGASFHVHAVDQGQPLPGMSAYEYRVRGVRKWLADLPRPLGVFAFNDRHAASISVMCRHAGILVPEEVALLGMGNRSSICEVTTPTLSSVDPAMGARTRRAMLLLRDMMKGVQAPETPIVIPPAGIVERQSTDLLAVDDPAVARALRFMWDHLEQNMSVDDVAEAVGVRRRSLERAFRGQLGRSVSTELNRKRLERCRHLLKTTELPVADIAPLSGFRSAGYLNKVFRRAFDTTPRKWRVAST
jgi:LacI family transcriptional regulator